MDLCSSVARVAVVSAHLDAVEIGRQLKRSLATPVRKTEVLPPPFCHGDGSSFPLNAESPVGPGYFLLTSPQPVNPRPAGDSNGIQG